MKKIHDRCHVEHRGELLTWFWSKRADTRSPDHRSALADCAIIQYTRVTASTMRRVSSSLLVSGEWLVHDYKSVFLFCHPQQRSGIRLWRTRLCIANSRVSVREPTETMDEASTGTDTRGGVSAEAFDTAATKRRLFRAPILRRLALDRVRCTLL